MSNHQQISDHSMLHMEHPVLQTRVKSGNGTIECRKLSQKRIEKNTMGKSGHISLNEEDREVNHSLLGEG